MAVARDKSNVSTGRLVEAASQLSLTDLGNLITELHALQAQKEAEDSLLAKISDSHLPPDRDRRYRELRKKLRAERITPEEHKELLGLSDEMEAKHVEWLEALIELSKLRGMTLPEVMRALGIKTPQVE